MSTFKPTFNLLGAVDVLSTATTTPAPAQQAMPEPAYCALCELPE
jgi:hypothetical protein